MLQLGLVDQILDVLRAHVHSIECSTASCGRGGAVLSEPGEAGRVQVRRLQISPSAHLLRMLVIVLLAALRFVCDELLNACQFLEVDAAISVDGAAILVARRLTLDCQRVGDASTVLVL